MNAAPRRTIGGQFFDLADDGIDRLANFKDKLQPLSVGFRDRGRNLTPGHPVRVGAVMAKRLTKCPE